MDRQIKSIDAGIEDVIVRDSMRCARLCEQVFKISLRLRSPGWAERMLHTAW